MSSHVVSATMPSVRQARWINKEAGITALAGASASSLASHEPRSASIAPSIPTKLFTKDQLSCSAQDDAGADSSASY